MKKDFISLVIPVYNSEDSVDELYNRSIKVLKDIGNYEIIYINDASKDDSILKLLKLAKNDAHVKIIDFSRNFGHQIAITAGIDCAVGDAVVVMDDDLQDTPETIIKMVKKWKEGYDVVYGQRRTRKDTLFKKITAFGFYRMLKKFANIDIPEDTGDFRLMDRSVVDEMCKLREHSRFMRGMTSWVGFKQTAVLFDREDRKYGEGNYSLGRLFGFAMDALTSFSYIPLRLSMNVGFLVAFYSVIGIFYAVYRRMFFPEDVVSGWAFLTIIILFLGSVQLIALGIIGEYIGRIYTETQGRPLYVIKNKINFE